MSLLMRYTAIGSRHSSHRILLRASSSTRSIIASEERHGDQRRYKTSAQQQQKPEAYRFNGDGWVPAAYRGAQKSDSSVPLRKDGRFSSKREPVSREKRSFDKHVDKRKILFKEFMVLWQKTVQRLARNYRKVVTGVNQLPLLDASNPQAEKLNSKNAADVSRMKQEMELWFDGIHPQIEADTEVDASAILASDDLYRGICRALQQTVESSVTLASTCTAVSERAAKIEDLAGFSQMLLEEAAEYVELAESGLLTLGKMQAERAALVDASVLAEKRQGGNGEAEESDESTLAPKGGLLQKLATFMFGDDLSGSEPSNTSKEQSSIVPKPLAHEDRGIGVTSGLLSSVIRLMYYSVGTHPTNHPDSSAAIVVTPDQRDRTTYRDMALRLEALLNLVPSLSDPSEIEIQELVLDMQRRAGTLESARACSATFRRSSGTNSQIRFALVLQAYLEAVMHESEDETRRLAAKEAVRVFNAHWNYKIPRHHVERVLHASIVLNCLCVANRIETSEKTDEKLFLLADGVLLRTLGKKSYEKLMNEFQSPNPALEHLSIPLVNYMTQFYARSGDDEKVEIAKKLLAAVIATERVGLGKMFVFPVVETANAVLQALVDRYENKARARWQGFKPDDDLSFAGKLLGDMLSRRESTSWPDDDSFELVFRLLLTIKPSDIGEQAEQVLSKMEVRNAFAPTNPVSFTLSTYHRVLRCYMEAARSGSGHEACNGALNILNKLEAQAYPLLLSDAESRMPVALPLYNIILRPTRTTYKLIFQVCTETKDKEGFESALRVANEANLRMEKRGIAPDKEAAKKLAFCRNRLQANTNEAAPTISTETLDLITKSNQETM